MKTHIEVRLLVWTIAIAMVTGAAASHAALYSGTWDPTYGAPYPSTLGWKGTATFNVPLSPPCNTNGTACATGAYVQDAHVDFYDTGTNAILATIDWTAGTLGTSYGISALTYVGNDVEFVASAALPYQMPVGYSGPSGSYGNFYIDAFSLQFVIDWPPIIPIDELSLLQVGFSGPLLFWTNTDCSECGSGVNDYVGNPPVNFVITQVPEPTTLLLLVTGMLAVGASARRPRAR